MSANLSVTFPQFLWKRRSCASAGEPLRFPLPSTGRIALLDTRLRPAANMRRFDPDDLRWLGDYQPEALVAPLNVALSLADRKLRGLFDLPSLSLAIVVLTTFDDSPLADHHRDLLWKAFGLPVFEQLRGASGEIIARECEVHDGLHIDGDTDHGFAGQITSSHCECGSETPRLLRTPVETRPLPRVAARSAAA